MLTTRRCRLTSPSSVLYGMSSRSRTQTRHRLREHGLTLHPIPESKSQLIPIASMRIDAGSGVAI
jgi:hypothetical protein